MESWIHTGFTGLNSSPHNLRWRLPLGGAQSPMSISGFHFPSHPYRSLFNVSGLRCSGITFVCIKNGDWDDAKRCLDILKTTGNTDTGLELPVSSFLYVYWRHAFVFSSRLWFDLASWGLPLDGDPTATVVPSFAGVDDISHERIALHISFSGSNITFVLLEPPSNVDSTAAHALTTSIVLLKNYLTDCVIRLTCLRTLI